MPLSTTKHAFYLAGLMVVSGCDAGPLLERGFVIEKSIAGERANAIAAPVVRQSSATTVTEDATAFAAKAQIPEVFILREKSASQTTKGTMHHFRLVFTPANLPVCGYKITAYKPKDGRFSAAFSGVIPAGATLAYHDDKHSFPSERTTLENTAEKLALRTNKDPRDFTSSIIGRCAFYGNDGFYNAFEVQLQTGQSGFTAYANATQIFDLEELSFTLGEATIKNVRARNLDSSDLVDVHIDDLLEDGKLASGRVKIGNPATDSCTGAFCSISGNKTTFQAEINECIDNQDNDDDGFVDKEDDACSDSTPTTEDDQIPTYTDQQTDYIAFANAHRIQTYFNQLGFTQFGKGPAPHQNQLTINLRTSIEQDGTQNLNNARFQPPNGDQPALIEIGPGDGRRLKGLMYSLQVLIHEYAHWVTFEWLRKISGKALVIHEASSDYYAAAMVGDACIAPSICVASCVGSCICRRITPQAPLCLRNIDNNKSVDDASFGPGENHLHSQALSGMLWKLRSDQGGTIPANDVAKLLYESRKYYPVPITYELWVAAILSAAQLDLELPESTLCKIVEAAESRRLFAENTIDCQDFELLAVQQHPDATPTPQPNDPEDKSAQSSGRSQDSSGETENFEITRTTDQSCATISQRKQSTRGGIWLLLFAPLLLPYFISYRSHTE